MENLDPEQTVAVLTDMWPSGHDPGAGSFVAGEVRALGDRFRQVVLVPRLLFPRAHRRIWGSLPGMEADWEQPPAPARLVRYPMIRVPRGSEVAPRAAGALRALGRAKERPLLVHGHFLRSVAPASVSLARRLGVPSIVTAHGTDARWLTTGGIQQRFRDEMLRACLAADRVIAVSRSIGEDLAALGVPAGRIAVITMGVDEERFRPADRAVARRELGLDPEAPVVIFVGGATPEKGFDVLGRALESLPGVRCIAAGAGPLECSRIDRLGVVADGGIARCLAAADVFCLPSLGEGTPVSIMEALAAGRPAVATSVGGIPDQIVPGVNGLLVAPGSAALLADALRDALDRRWDENAIRETSERYWWRTVGGQIGALYDGLLARDSQR